VQKEGENKQGTALQCKREVAGMNSGAHLAFLPDGCPAG